MRPRRDGNGLAWPWRTDVTGSVGLPAARSTCLPSHVQCEAQPRRRAAGPTGQFHWSPSRGSLRLYAKCVYTMRAQPRGPSSAQGLIMVSAQCHWAAEHGRPARHVRATASTTSRPVQPASRAPARNISSAARAAKGRTTTTPVRQPGGPSGCPTSRARALWV